MKKYLIFPLSMLIFTACSSTPTNLTNDNADKEPTQPAAVEKYLGFIKFKGELLTEDNFESLSQEYEKIPSLDKDQTQVILSMDNHQEDLEEMISLQNFSIDGNSPLHMDTLTIGAGGHHFTVLLTFPSIESTKFDLKISELPVEEGSLTFTK